ncbi:MAG: NADH-quinone oxidoreductase subunit C/D [Methanobacteriota archaeon]|uniref:NADH-quinone oxidoreductase subunit D n=1 Tax=Halorutilus salinus TaxID=2487751 RepID=UPI0030B865BE
MSVVTRRHEELHETIEDELPDAILDFDEHHNAPAVVANPSRVDDVVRILKQNGYNHLSSVSAVEYDNRYESVYHLRRITDDREDFDEINVVAPADPDEPAVETVSDVFKGANWHEREAYDLMGIRYDNHPDMRRILLPETWKGHPLRDEYDVDQPQYTTLEAHANPIEERYEVENDAALDTMFLNIGPHHPATHGVLHLKTVLDGEVVVDVDPDIGYLHRCEEYLCERLDYKYQIMPYPDRWDYVSAGMLNEMAYARCIEDLAEIDVPEYAQVIRVLAQELSRIAAHMLAVGTFALDIYGELNVIFMYAFKDREIVQEMLEDLSGQRLMFNYLRLGGVAYDLPEPRDEWFGKIRGFLDDLPGKMDEYRSLLEGNELLRKRAEGTGILEPETAKEYGCTGPVLRGSGVGYDVREVDPYGYYDELDWDVVTYDGCDNLSRVLVRLGEVEESARLVEQCVDILESWDGDREIQSRVPRSITPPAETENYTAVEGAKGELGIHIVSDGTEKPHRFKIRSPCFSNLAVFSELAEGEYLADMIATLGSLDLVFGEVDR